MYVIMRLHAMLAINLCHNEICSHLIRYMILYLSSHVVEHCHHPRTGILPASRGLVSLGPWARHCMERSLRVEPMFVSTRTRAHTHTHFAISQSLSPSRSLASPLSPSRSLARSFTAIGRCTGRRRRPSRRRQRARVCLRDMQL